MSARHLNAAAPARDAQARAEALLSLRGISQRFGSLQVLNHLNLDVRAGDTLGLIGPNGAGKTSLLNVASGFSRAHAGCVCFKGRDVSRLSPVRRARLGLMRSFQSSQVFPEHSVRHNLALALRASAAGAYAWVRAGRLLHDSLARAEQIIEHSVFAGRGDAMAGLLSYGEQRLLDLLLSLTPQPELLLLDEPTAGLSKQEARSAMALLQTLRGDSTVVLVSHDLDLVFEHCSRIAVLNLGELIAVDERDAIRRHEGARQAYLGGFPP